MDERSLRNEGGHSLKSSIFSSLVIDKRNDSIVPSSGYYLKLLSEFAGLGGDVGFLKNVIETQCAFPLGPCVSEEFIVVDEFFPERWSIVSFGSSVH